MRVKRYVVDSMPQALQKIRSDLGKDAVILNTKEVRSGGFLGLFGKKKIEVIAATETASHDSRDNLSIPQPVMQGAVALEDAAGQVSATVETLIPQTTQSIVQESVLFEEIKQMKQLVIELSRVRTQPSMFPHELQKWEQRLIEQEVEPPIVQSLLHKVLDDAEMAGEQLSDQLAHQLVRKHLLNLLELKMDPHKGLSPQTKLVHFVGPTGVGKTTTIAKLAAEQVLKHNRKVGFITSDTYRIAAIEQLKTYATILNVPIEVVFSPQELTKVFQQLEDRDIIFMDTAGRNFRNEMYVSELNSLLQTEHESETYLVLSLTMKYKDMKVITDNFSKFKLNRVLFTKKDETDSYGSIVNLAHDYRLQHSYITNGQNVPDDIVELDEGHLVDLILGEDSDE